MTQKIVIFGKGGIGKSTITSNLAAAYAQSGKRVLLVGCDPKHDTTVSLTEGKPIRPVVDLPGFMDMKARRAEVVKRGRLGVDCVESGGPEPGIGCAGRGISRTVEILEQCGLLADGVYDVILFDVLGDVVCGGFAAPLRKGLADKVCVIASEELMALYACNNIARAIVNYASNDIGLCGIVANLKDPGSKRDSVERFAALIGTKVLEFLPRDIAVRRAEFERRTAVEMFPKAEFSKRMKVLADTLLDLDIKKVRVPDPLGDEEFHELSRIGFEGGRRPKARPAAPKIEGPVSVLVEKARREVEALRGEDVDNRLEKALEAWSRATGKSGGWVDGPHALQWGEASQWRTMFCDRETGRNYDQHVQLDAPMVGITHEDLECHYATPFFNDGYMTYFNFKWIQRGRREEEVFASGCIGFTTDIREMDVVRGGGEKLKEALDLALERSEGKSAILVTSTCVPTVIGDDSVGIIEDYRHKTELPILFSSPASGQELNLLEYFFKRVRETPAFKAARPEDRAVNLIGFPPGPGRRELVELLGYAGIRVNLCLLPRFNVEEVKRFGGASLHVFYPDPHYKGTFQKLFGDMELKSLSPVAPYGMANTQRWLAEVTAGLGIKDAARDAWDMKSVRVAAAWKTAMERVRGKRLGFVADAEHVRALADPCGMAGIPLVTMVKEMGFGVDYLVYHEGKEPSLDVKGGRHGVRWFSTPSELGKLLREGEFDAVYSEFFFDERLTSAGKAQFSLLDVEMGLEGAVRSLERFVDICRWPFYKRCLPAAGVSVAAAPPRSGQESGRPEARP
ncbi:MAG: AAA family ATPase [Elusimicrobia bacterium]|nr:AAA family ATPase [Elusimicrobiota bacterium]